MKSPREAGALRPLPSLIFASRWLQLQITADIAAPLKREEASGLLASGELLLECFRSEAFCA